MQHRPSLPLTLPLPAWLAPDMPALDPQLKRALADQVEFYRELGIYELYRREIPLDMLKQNDSGESTEPLVEINHPADTGGFKENVAPAGILPENLTGDRAAALQVVRDDLGECTRCRLWQGRKHIVFGTGNPHAQLMFVGEGPGADEDEQGVPFVGRAGKLLNNMIQAMGLERKQVYIANVVKCRPPENRTPERDECNTCSPFLVRQIEVVKPRALVALGAVAARTLLGMSDSMARLRGSWHDFHGIRMAVTYHPAYLLRDPRQKKETWKDLQMVMQFLGLSPPAKGQNPAAPEL